MTAPGGVLVIGPAWVGDMVMAQSLFITLHQREPTLPIDVVAPAWSLPLLRRMPEVREGIELDVGHGEVALRRRLQLGAQLRARRYARAIVLPRSLKSALVPWAARIPRRTGFRGEMRYGLLNDIRSLDRKRLESTVQRFVSLGLGRGETLPPPTPYPWLAQQVENQKHLVRELKLETKHPCVALLPGAEYGPAKRWPALRFAELARRLGEMGRRCWVLGSAKERELGAQIARDSGGAARNLCGDTRLEDVVDLLALCETAVTNDSGLMHVAAATGCHVVAIYGSSSPRYTPPLTEHAAIVSLELECSPCFERECPLGHTNCLNQLDVDRVFAACAPSH